jgi:hypothetical protein
MKHKFFGQTALVVELRQVSIKPYNVVFGQLIARISKLHVVFSAIVNI